MAKRVLYACTLLAKSDRRYECGSTTLVCDEGTPEEAIRKELIVQAKKI